MSKLLSAVKKILNIKTGILKQYNDALNGIQMAVDGYKGDISEEEFNCHICGNQAFALCEHCGEPYCEDCNGSGVSSVKCIDYNCCSSCAEKGPEDRTKKRKNDLNKFCGEYVSQCGTLIRIISVVDGKIQYIRTDTGRKSELEVTGNMSLYMKEVSEDCSHILLNFHKSDIKSFDFIKSTQYCTTTVRFTERK